MAPRCELRTRELGPERLDPARFRLRALIFGPQCGANLLRVEQIDIRRIGLDPKRLRLAASIWRMFSASGMRDSP